MSVVSPSFCVAFLKRRNALSIDSPGDSRISPAPRTHSPLPRSTRSAKGAGETLASPGCHRRSRYIASNRRRTRSPEPQHRRLASMLEVCAWAKSTPRGIASRARDRCPTRACRGKTNTRVTSRHLGLKSRGARAEFQSWRGSVGLLEMSFLSNIAPLAGAIKQGSRRLGPAGKQQ
jgi:hypothetical protein